MVDDGCDVQGPDPALTTMASIDDVPIGGGGGFNFANHPDAYPPGEGPPDATPFGAPPAETESFSGPLEQRLKHKNWKARKEAFDELAKLFAEAENSKDPVFATYGEFMRDAVKDGNASALEAGLDCCKAYVMGAGDEVSHIAGMVAGCTEKGLNSRPKAISTVQEIFVTLTEFGHGNAVMEGMGNTFAKCKGPKHKQHFSATLLTLVTDFGVGVFETKLILDILVKIIVDTDGETRKAARQVAVCLHAAMGPAFTTLLEKKGVKASTVAEVTKDVEAAEPIKPPTRSVKGATSQVTTGAAPAASSISAEALLYDEAEPEPVLKYLTKEFYATITDPKAKWAEKQSMMNELLFTHISKVKLQSGDYYELTKALKKALGDPNVAMVGLASKAFSYLTKGLRANFSKELKMLFPTLLDMLKEKKHCVMEPIRETLDTIFQHNILNPVDIADDLAKAAGDKILLIRVGVLQWMERCVTSDAPTDKIARWAKVFAPVFVKSCEDTDGSVRDAATKVAAACVKALGEAECSFLEELPQKTRDKVFTAQKAPAIASSSSSVSLKRPQRTHSAPRLAAEDEPAAPPAKAASSKTLRSGGGAAKQPKAKAAAADTTESVGVPGRAAAEEQLRSMAPDVADSILEGLMAKNFKERQNAVQTLRAALNQADNPAHAAEVGSAIFYASTPGWKDATFQVLSEMIGCILDLCGKVDALPKHVVVACVPVVDKLQDMKVKKAIRELLMKFAECTSPHFTVSRVISHMPDVKSPKVIQEVLEWMADVILDFGQRQTDERAVLGFAKGCIENQPLVKTAAIKLVVALRTVLGEKAVLAQLSDLRPALLKQVEEECAKVQETKHVPVRQVKGCEAAAATGGLNEPRDIRGDIEGGLLDRMSSANWKDRNEALEELSRILQAGKVKPEVGPDLLPALKARLADTNKNLIGTACHAVAHFFEAVGPSARAHAPKLLPTITTLLGDQKPQVRQGARKALEAFDKQCGLDGVLPFLPKAMATDVPYARQELCDFVLGALTRDAAKLPPGALLPTVQPIVGFLQDRHGETRRMAEEMLKFVITNVGYDAVAKHVGNLGAANQRALQPILDKNKQCNNGQAMVKPVPKKSALRTPRTEDDRENAQMGVTNISPTKSQSQARIQKPVMSQPYIYEDPEQDEGEEYKPKQVFKSMTRDMRSELPDQTPMMPRQQPTITTLHQAIEVLGKADTDMCLRAVEKIQGALAQQREVPVDEVMLKAMGRLTSICTDPDIPLDSRLVKALIGLMQETFQVPLSLRAQSDTLFYLIGALLDNLLTEKLHVAYRENPTTEIQRRNADEILRSLNSLMLKILERGNRTSTFCALIKRLDMYNKMIYNDGSRYVKYVELVAKCLLKLIRFVTQDSPTDVDFTKLLGAAHEFLTENPPTNFKNRMELPLRTVKTLLNELVKVKGSAIRDCLRSLSIPENALIAEFISMCLEKQGVSTEVVSAAPPTAPAAVPAAPAPAPA
eukprot:Sspe_Gene.9799::Locus_3304_Transcript_1_3_Confidence_0.286_Length_4510::g.9799::m.9799/K16803/CKAP5, XMAP215; cytoskeleton-associated protein 5